MQKLSENKVFAIGNGKKDRKMVAGAAIGIALIQQEGGSSETGPAAVIVSCHIIDAWHF